MNDGNRISETWLEQRSDADLFCPFPSNLHPLTRLVSERTLAWATDFGLIQRSDVARHAHSERFTWLVGRFFPQASLPVLQLISDFTSWLFWHDDVCDETEVSAQPLVLGERFDRFFDILRGEQPAQSPRPQRASDGALPTSAFETALAEMSGRFNALAPDAPWSLRFLTSVREYFDACIWEAQNRSDGIVPSVGNFIPLRRCAGGMWIYLDFVELCTGRSLPLQLRKHRDVQRLVQITNNVASWHNDLFSLAKEQRSGDVHNLVIALQAELALPLEPAIEVAVGYANAEVRAFIALEQKLSALDSAGRAALDPYVRGLKDLMRGNLDWSIESGRYRQGAEPNETLPARAAAHSDIRELLRRRAAG